MSRIRTSGVCAFAAALAAAVAGVACSPGGSSQCNDGPLRFAPAAAGVIYACNLPPPTIIVSGPCEAGAGEAIYGVGVGTCVVDIEFPNGLKFSAAIQYTAYQFQEGCQTGYAPSLYPIVIGDVPMCDEPDGALAGVPPQCSCLLIDEACDSGALCLDAGKWDGAVYTP